MAISGNLLVSIKYFLLSVKKSKGVNPGNRSHGVFNFNSLNFEGSVRT